MNEIEKKSLFISPFKIITFLFIIFFLRNIPKSKMININENSINNPNYINYTNNIFEKNNINNSKYSNNADKIYNHNYTNNTNYINKVNTINNIQK